MSKTIYCTNFVIPVDVVRVYGQPATEGFYGGAKFFIPAFETKDDAKEFLKIFDSKESGKIFELKNGFRVIWED